LGAGISLLDENGYEKDFRRKEKSMVADRVGSLHSTDVIHRFALAEASANDKFTTEAEAPRCFRPLRGFILKAPS